jgi:hypothetical protein
VVSVTDPYGRILGCEKRKTLIILVKSVGYVLFFFFVRQCVLDDYT